MNAQWQVGMELDSNKLAHKPHGEDARGRDQKNFGPANFDRGPMQTHAD